MKRLTRWVSHLTFIFAIALLPALCPVTAGAQIVPVLKTKNTRIDNTFKLSVQILYRNTQDNLIKAGGEYGGEWTRDCSINSWNAASLLEPESAQYSLWSVTTDNRTYIGHQYWDQIIWVTGAYDYYEKTGDRAFLNQAYIASTNTMTRLEREHFDSRYGLFKGPSVFNDGIAGYEEPIYVPGNTSSYVLDHKASEIKCLSTNAIYYNAYLLLAKMANFKGETSAERSWLRKAANLKTNIRKHLFNGNDKLYYLIDQNNNVHQFQEALGVAYAVLFGVVSKEEGRRIIDGCYKGRYGTPSIYPHFKRFDNEHPGRHNKIIWPFVSAFFAAAANEAGSNDRFSSELQNLARLCQGANSKRNGTQTFYEIYNEITGVPDGGWQCGSHWGSSVYDQTWSATGFIRLILTDMLGMRFTPEGLTFEPNIQIINEIGFEEIKDVTYRGGTLSITTVGTGDRLVAVKVDGVSQLPVTPIAPQAGNRQIELVFGSDLNLTEMYNLAELELKQGETDSIVASKMFSRDDLPTGSIIQVDEGYVYLPEGWESDTKTATPRPETVAKSVTVTDGWWSYYKNRSFNVSKADGTNLSIDEAQAHFRIYLPNVLAGGGACNIINKNSEKPLVVRSDDNTTVTQDSEATPTLWTVEYLAGGYYCIIDPQSGNVLQVPEGTVRQNTRPTLAPRTDGRNQQWNVIEVSKGLYRIVPKSAPLLTLDVSGSSTNNGATVLLRTYEAADSQRWQFNIQSSNGIRQPSIDKQTLAPIFDISGREVSSVRRKGIYIQRNKKFLSNIK